MSITRDDVARLAGVSPATVSYVINNGPRPVAVETRKRVLAAIERLNYHPNTIARSLKTQKTFTAGIVITDILNPTLASIEKSIEDLLIQQDYSLTVCNSNESPERELMWLNTLRDHRMDGVILLPTGANRPRLFAIFDNEGGAYQAVNHLIALGHTRIGLLNLPGELSPGQGRLRGYTRALRDAGLPFLPQLVREGSFIAQEGFMLAGELLDARPTALFVSSNRLAQGVFEQIKARHLIMPDDLALCTFDDVAYFNFFTPSITAVSADPQEFGVKAVQFLIERIEGTYQGEPRTYLVPCHLVARESTIGMQTVPQES
jgi:DNA-binding LacI/PurR family transcriptional regulator